MSADREQVAGAIFSTLERVGAPLLHRECLAAADVAMAMLKPREWVVGFLFDDEAETVILVRKNRPEWQAGKLNGVGGKVEPGETIFDQASVTAVRTMTDESIERHLVHRLAMGLRDEVTPNLMWLVPLAAHRHDSYDLIDVVETGTVLRKPGRLDILPGSPK